MRRLRFMVVPLLLVSSTVKGQSLSEVAPGTRVRIQAPGVVAGRYAGTVLSRTADTLVVASSGASVARVPIASLSSVEVSRGKSRSRGAVKGTVWGASIGLAFGVLTMGVVDDTGPYGSEGEYVAYNLAGGAIWGAVIGAIVGSERWDRFDLARRTSVHLPAPETGGRLSVGLRVAFGAE